MKWPHGKIKRVNSVFVSFTCGNFKYVIFVFTNNNEKYRGNILTGFIRNKASLPLKGRRPFSDN